MSTICNVHSVVLKKNSQTCVRCYCQRTENWNSYDLTGHVLSRSTRTCLDRTSKLFNFIWLFLYEIISEIEEMQSVVDCVYADWNRSTGPAKTARTSWSKCVISWRSTIRPRRRRWRTCRNACVCLTTSFKVSSTNCAWPLVSLAVTSLRLLSSCVTALRQRCDATSARLRTVWTAAWPPWRSGSLPLWLHALFAN